MIGTVISMFLAHISCEHLQGAMYVAVQAAFLASSENDW